MAPGDHCMCGSEIGLQLDSPGEQEQRFVRILGHRGEHGRQSAQIEVIGIEAVRPLAPRAFDLALTERRLDDAGDADRDFVLEVEDVFERAVEAVGPEMRAAGRINQLRGDAHPVSICGRPPPGKGKRWGRVARGRMLSSVRPLMRQDDSRRPVWEFADRVQITHSVLEAQWKALVVPAPSRRLLRHTLLPLALTSSRSWSAYAAAAGVL